MYLQLKYCKVQVLWNPERKDARKWKKYRIELQEKHIKRSKPLINEEIIHGKIDNRELKTIS